MKGISDSAMSGALKSPVNAKAVVLLITTQGSQRRRNSAKSPFERSLEREGFATMKVDLSSGQQNYDRWEAFDVGVAASRIRAAALWLKSNPETKRLPIGVYAEGIGAAAALSATARNSEELDSMIEAVVCRCGRPDLASKSLNDVTKPTLLIVGEEDRPIADLNRAAFRELAGPKDFAMIAGAGQLFDEPMALEQANQLTKKWYMRFLRGKESASQNQEYGKTKEAVIAN